MLKLFVKILIGISISIAIVTLALPACGLGGDSDSVTDTEPYVYGEELITNGDFSVNANWEFYVNNLSPVFAQGTGTITNGEYVMQMTQLSQSDTVEGWHGALKYVGKVPLIQGRTYEVSFDAKATGNVKFGAGFLLAEEPYTYYGGIFTDISSEMRTYTDYFTMEEVDDSIPNLNFAIGNHLEMVTVDNVSVREVISGYSL